MPSRAALWWLPLLLALSFRLLNAVCSRAYFQPDEYWQNLEVAHRWIYGYGYQTWEWRSTPGDGEKWGSSAAEDIAHLLRTGGHGGIRSPLSVVVTAAVYALLKALAWDSGNLLVLAPRLAQACIAASADLAVRRLATRLLGPSYANAALFVLLTSFFNFHTSTRTFSNATETALTAWALALWPWGLHRMSTATRLNGPKRPRPRWQGSLAAALGLAALASLIRPSNAVIWLALGAQLLLIAGLFSFALDSAFYGTPTLTPLRFLHTNVVQSISLFYGANAWHFYLSQGLPILLVTQLPFCLRGLFRLGEGEEGLRALRRTVGATLAAYSLLSHKEWRFLHPLLPALHIFVARCLVHSDLAFTSKNGRTSAATAWIRTQLRIRPAHAGWVALSLLPALYLTAFHGIAQNRVMGHLRAALERDAAVRGGGGGGGSEVGFLMPCHSTGWQAFLHRPEMEEPLSLVDGSGNGRRRRRMWMVTCEPPVS
ncbi:glycosylphosphatidylinositol anchor biosynthesis [Rhodotorula sphaerocarpa]